MHPTYRGSWPASEGGLPADPSPADAPDLLWELACQRRRPDSRPITCRCTRSTVGAGLPAMAACQPTHHPQVYQTYCGREPAPGGVPTITVHQPTLVTRVVLLAPTTTTSGVRLMINSDSICDCPKCSCKLGAHPIARHGKHYCCEACAKHHEHGEECSSKGCKCAHAK